MTELTLSELKDIEFSLLKKIKSICEEHNLRYYLAYGTLIGAVRHKGFIPWDDDIDICMPREDYDKFLCICGSINDVSVRCHEYDNNYFCTFIKFCEPDTTVITSAGSNAFDFGVYIDIFPIDGLGNSYKKARKAINSVKYIRFINAANCYAKYYKIHVKWYKSPFKYIIYILSKIVGKQYVYNKIENISKKYDFDSSIYVGVYASIFGEREIMKKTVYDAAVDTKFEKEMFKAPAGYEEYLTKIYGDYMTPPPPEKRIPKHDFTAYRK